MWGEAAVRLEVGETLEDGQDELGSLHEGVLAQHPILVRRFHARLSEHPEVVGLLSTRLPSIRGFQHPHIVELLDLRLEESPPTLVYARPEGRPLKSLLREQKRLTVSQAITVSKGLAAALQAAHAAGHVHGDLQTRNVFVDGTGRAQLLGFGLGEATCALSGFRSLGLGFGHPLFLAPEAVELAAPTPQTDVYALGILIQRMVLGAHPYGSKDLREVLRQHREASLPTEHRGVTLPPKLASVLAAMTAKDPAQRPALGPALFEELHQVDAFEGSLCEEDSPLIPLPPKPPEPEPAPVVAEAPAAAAGAEAPAPAAPTVDPTGSAIQQAVETVLASSSRRAAAVKQAPALAPRGQLRPAQLVGSLLGLVGLGAALVVFASGRSADPQPQAAAARPPPPARTPVAPSEVAARQQEQAAQALAELETLGGEVEAALQTDPARAQALLEQAPAGVTSREGAARLSKLRGRVAAAQRAELVARIKQVQRQLEAGDLWRGAAAWRRLRERHRRRPRLLLEPAVQAVVHRIERWERARSWEAARLRAAGRVDVQVVQGQLTSRLQGWADGGRVFYGGGVALRYHRPAQLLADLRPRAGAKHRLAKVTAGGESLPAVCLEEGDLRLPLPLERPLDVTLELVLQAPAQAAARFEVYCGRVGSSWGLATTPTRANPSELPSRKRLLLRLRFDDRSASSLTLATSLARAGAAPGRVARQAVARKDARGGLTLRVRGGAVWITQLEVRGALDLRGLK